MSKNTQIKLFKSWLETVKINHNLVTVPQRLDSLKALSSWKITVDENMILRKFPSSIRATTSKFTVKIDGLGFTIQVFDWFIPENHDVYRVHCRSMKYVTVSVLVNHRIIPSKLPGITFSTCIIEWRRVLSTVG